MNKTEIVEKIVKIKFLVKDASTTLALKELDSLLDKLCSSSTVNSKSKFKPKSHRDTCLSESDPYGGPCNCDRYYDDSDL